MIKPIDLSYKNFVPRKIYVQTTSIQINYPIKLDYFDSYKINKEIPLINNPIVIDAINKFKKEIKK